MVGFGPDGQSPALLLVQSLEDAGLPHVFPHYFEGSGEVGVEFSGGDFDELPPEGGEFSRLVNNCALFESELLHPHAQVRLLGVLVLVESRELLAAAEGAQAGPKQILGGVAVTDY